MAFKISHSHKADIIIVGGGVLGISLAYHLSFSKLSVILLEKEKIVCSHASAKNAGMIRQLYRDPQLTEWAKESIRTWPEEIQNRHFKQTGSIILGRELPSHHHKLFTQDSISINEHRHNYIHTPTDGLLESEDYVHSLKQIALSQGKLKIIPDCKVLSISKTNLDNWLITTENKSKKNLIFETNLLVNATGAWINSILHETPNLAVDAEAYVRHLFISKGWDQKSIPITLPQHGFYWDEFHQWYRRNWTKDTQLVSACDQESADPDSYSPNTNSTLDLAQKILDSLSEKGEKITLGLGWYCFRTYTKDQLPIIGFDSTYNNFYWLGAFGGFGMSTSFAATKAAANEILTGKKMIDQRFSEKRCKKEKDRLTFSSINQCY